MDLWGVYIKSDQIRLGEQGSKELARMIYTTRIGKHGIERIRKGEQFITSPLINARIKQLFQQTQEDKEFFKVWWSGEIRAEVRLKEKKIITEGYDPLGVYYSPKSKMLEGIGLASLVELQVERDLLKKYKGFTINSSDKVTGKRRAQLLKRGRKIGEPIQLERAKDLTKKYIVQQHRLKIIRRGRL